MTSKPTCIITGTDAARLRFELYFSTCASTEVTRFPTILPTNTLNPRKTPQYLLKRANTRRTSNPLQHKGLEVLPRYEWVQRKSIYGFLVRMRSAVRIRPAAPKRKPPGRVVFCFGKLRCGVEVYPRRGKSVHQLQQFPPKSKGLGGFCYSRPAGKSCGGRRFMLYIKVCLRIQPEESEGLAS